MNSTPGQARQHHVVERISAAAAHADHLDDRAVRVGLREFDRIPLLLDHGIGARNELGLTRKTRTILRALV
jgi:hypothetical protein